MDERILSAAYIGADGDDFRKEFVEYLEQILSTKRWDAMSDYTLYLQGAKKALEEIVAEIKQVGI
jgi:uncharacterized membrane protein